ncbi:hypothetical protein BgiMline_028557, partial [Biomphalaria glabrata]
MFRASHNAQVGMCSRFPASCKVTPLVGCYLVLNFGECVVLPVLSNDLLTSCYVVYEADNDFVYSTKINVDQHASNRTPSPCPDYGQENNVHLNEVDRSSWATESSGDEEIATPMDTSHEE